MASLVVVVVVVVVVGSTTRRRVLRRRGGGGGGVGIRFVCLGRLGRLRSVPRWSRAGLEDACVLVASRVARRPTCRAEEPEVELGP